LVLFLWGLLINAEVWVRGGGVTKTAKEREERVSGRKTGRTQELEGEAIMKGDGGEIRRSKGVEGERVSEERRGRAKVKMAYCELLIDVLSIVASRGWCEKRERGEGTARSASLS